MSFFKIFKWLFCESPTEIRRKSKKEPKYVCSYCGNDDTNTSHWKWTAKDDKDTYIICHYCRKKVYDILLKENF